jgi:flagellar protein FliL
VLAGTAPPNSSAGLGSASEATGAKFPLVPLLIAVVIGFVLAALGAGGVVYYLARTGRLPERQAAAHQDEITAPTTTHAIALEPLLVNLSDANGNSYLRAAMTLRVADVAKGKDAKAKEETPKEDKGVSDAVASVRDTMLVVLGQQTADGLLAVDGKEHLKTELKAALAKHNPDLKVMDIFFTDFLVQR